MNVFPDILTELSQITPSFLKTDRKKKPSHFSESFTKILMSKSFLTKQLGRNHRDLHTILSCYNPFVLRRSILAGRTARGTPTYDPVSSSLRVFNTLALSEISSGNLSISETLVGAKIIAKLRAVGQITESALITDFQSAQISSLLILNSIETLRKKGFLTASGDLALSDRFQQLQQTSVEKLDLAKAQYLGSLRHRLVANDSKLEAATMEESLLMVDSFLEGLCRNRGLGVAQNLVASNPDQVTLRAVALLQTFPKHLESCSSRESAICSISLASGILSRPTDKESKYLGSCAKGISGNT